MSVELINGFSLTSGQSFLIVDVGNSLTRQLSGLDEGDLVDSFNGVDLFISYAGGDGNDIELFTAADSLLGDVNLDGVVNLLDVAPFIDLLCTGNFQFEADIILDGVVNLLDVDPFILLLAGS